MEEEAREEGSSSQNVNKTVSSIRERGTYIGIYLSDSSSFFILPDDFLQLRSSFSLETGTEIPEGSPLSEKLAYLDNICRAFNKAFDIISFAPCTAAMLKLKLMKKGFDRHSCDKAVACLKEKKLVDDRKFAENWVTSRLARNPESPLMLKAALMRKGVDRQVAEEVLAHLTPDSSEYIGAFEKAFEKQLRKSGVTDEKIKIRLAAKGYPLSLINRYLEKNR